MAKRVFCEKKTKIYIPKTNNSILSCTSSENAVRDNLKAILKEENKEEYTDMVKLYGE